jgi:hypothetical protein
MRFTTTRLSLAELPRLTLTARFIFDLRSLKNDNNIASYLSLKNPVFYPEIGKFSGFSSKFVLLRIKMTEKPGFWF